MAVDAGDIVATLKADTKDFDQGLQRSDKQLIALGASSVAVGNIATEAFNYIAAGAINTATAIARWASEAGKAAEHTENLSMQLGISERTLEGWGMAASEAGLDIDSMAGGMKALSRQMEGVASGNEKNIQVFNKLGLSIDAVDAASMDTETTIKMVADRFAQMPDGVEKTSLALQLFGRAGLQLLPILNKGSAGLEQSKKDADQLGYSLTDTQRGAIKNYDAAIDRLSSSLQGFRNQVAAAFAPSLTRTIEFMTSAVSYAKTIFTAFSDAAEKLFIRFGAMAASIELLAKQVFSLNVLNTESWKLTLDQISAIDDWAAKQLKAVGATHEYETEIKKTNGAVKEYAASQKALGEGIVSTTQIQLKQTQAMKDAALAAMHADIELGQRREQYAKDQSREFFSSLFADEDRSMKDVYAGSDVMIANVNAKQKALNDSMEQQQHHVDAITQAYIDEGMAADAALVAQTAAEVEADKNNEMYQGKFMTMLEQRRQALQFGWGDVFGEMSQSAQFAFGSIRAGFGQTVANLVQGTANWRQFWQNTQSAIINSFVQFGIDIVGKYLAKNAMILASEAATATGVTTLWTATSGAVMGAFGAMTAGIQTFFIGTIMPMFAAVGEAVMTFLASLATALDISIFGAPFSIPVWAAVGLVAAAVGVISAFAFGAFAEGGIVKGPMMGLVGEAGPEAIIPLDKLGGLMNSGEQTINIYLDGKVLSRSVYKTMPTILRQRGMAGA